MDKKEVYTVRCGRDTGYTSRILSAENTSAVVDRAIRLYFATWKNYPDTIKLTRKLY